MCIEIMILIASDKVLMLLWDWLACSLVPMTTVVQHSIVQLKQSQRIEGNDSIMLQRTHTLHGNKFSTKSALQHGPSLHHSIGRNG